MKEPLLFFFSISSQLYITALPLLVVSASPVSDMNLLLDWISKGNFAFKFIKFSLFAVPKQLRIVPVWSCLQILSSSVSRWPEHTCKDGIRVNLYSILLKYPTKNHHCEIKANIDLVTVELVDGCLFINRPKCLGFLNIEMHYERVYFILSVLVIFQFIVILRENGHFCFSPNVLLAILEGFGVFLMARIIEWL